MVAGVCGAQYSREFIAPRDTSAIDCLLATVAWLVIQHRSLLIFMQAGCKVRQHTLKQSQANQSYAMHSSTSPQHSEQCLLMALGGAYQLFHLSSSDHFSHPFNCVCK
jgi:hypothetical protein